MGKFLKKLAPPFVIMVVLMWTSVSWAMSLGMIELEISVADHNTFSDGEPVKVTPLYTDHESITQYAYAFRNEGKAKKIGLPLFKVHFSDVSYLTMADFYLSANKSTVKNGDYRITQDKWWLVTGIYYEISPTSLTDGDIQYTINGETRYFRKIEGTVSRLNNQQAIKTLEIPAANLPQEVPTTVYIMGSYMNPAEKIPPGKQKHLTQLQFNCYISF